MSTSGGSGVDSEREGGGLGVSSVVSVSSVFFFGGGGVPSLSLWEGVLDCTLFTECLALGRRDAVEPCAGGRLDLGQAAFAADERLFGGAERRGSQIHGGRWATRWVVVSGSGSVVEVVVVLVVGEERELSGPRLPLWGDKWSLAGGGKTRDRSTRDQAKC